jgi:hypothetical protein
MSGFSPNFSKYLFDPNFATLKSYRDGLQVEAKVTYGVGPFVDGKYCEEWKDSNRRSFMLGLLVTTTQHADVEYRDAGGNWFALDKEEDTGSGIPKDLLDSIGTPPGRKWVGFKQPRAKDWALGQSLLPFSVVQFDVRFGVYPTTGPEFVPFVGRHRQDKTGSTTFAGGTFGSGYILSVWYVPAPPRKRADGKQYMSGQQGSVEAP